MGSPNWPVLPSPPIRPPSLRASNPPSLQGPSRGPRLASRANTFCPLGGPRVDPRPRSLQASEPGSLRGPIWGPCLASRANTFCPLGVPERTASEPAGSNLGPMSGIPCKYILPIVGSQRGPPAKPPSLQASEPSSLRAPEPRPSALPSPSGDLACCPPPGCLAAHGPTSGGEF